MKTRLLLSALFLSVAGLILFIFSNKQAPPPAPIKNSKGLYSFGAIPQVSKKIGEEVPKEGFQKLTAYVVPEINRDDLLDYLKDDSACKIENSTFTFSDGAAALLKAPDLLKVEPETDKLLSELFTSNDSVKSPEAENITKFFNAIMFADLFFGTDSPEINYQKADALLDELKNSDPDNGAYDFVDGYVLSKLNAPDSQIRAEFYNGLQKKHVDFFSDTIQRRIFEKSFASPSYWLVYLKILGRLDEINISPIAFLLQKYIQSGDAEFNKAAVHFSRLLIPESVKEGPPPNLNKWEKSYYMFGQKILAWSWPKAYPGQPMPDYRPLKFLVVVSLNSLGQGEEAFDHLTKSPSNFYTCKRDLFDIWFTQNKILEVNRREQ